MISRIPTTDTLLKFDVLLERGFVTNRIRSWDANVCENSYHGNPEYRLCISFSQSKLVSASSPNWGNFELRRAVPILICLGLNTPL